MLLTSQRLGEVETEEPSMDAADAGGVEALRHILAKQAQREIGYSEAQEIGASLIEFYQVLAEEMCDDSEV